MNTITGEILDLSKLQYPPRGKPTKRLPPVQKFPKYRSRQQRQLAESWLIVGALTLLVILTKLATE